MNTPDHLQLSSSQWSAGQVVYIGWLATPKKLRPRGLRTDIAFAHSIGVHRNTLRKWKQIPGFRDEVSRLTRLLIGDRLPDVLQTLEELAVEGSIGHMRLYFKLLGITGPERQPIIGIKEIQGVRLEDV